MKLSDYPKLLIVQGIEGRASGNWNAEERALDCEEGEAVVYERKTKVMIAHRAEIKVIGKRRH